MADFHGAVAQLGERLVCNQEATGSIPVSSTRNLRLADERESDSEGYRRVPSRCRAIRSILLDAAQAGQGKARSGNPIVVRRSPMVASSGRD